MNFTSGATYRFINEKYSNHALNVYGNNAASAGRNVCLYEDTPSDIMQKWIVTRFHENDDYGFVMRSIVNQNFVLGRSDGSISSSYENNAHLCAESSTNPLDYRVEFINVTGNIYRICLPGRNLYLTATNTNLKSTGVPASSISTSAALIGGTGGESNVYWTAAATSGTTYDKQCWTVEALGSGTSGGGSTRPGNGSTKSYPSNYLVYPTKYMNITQNTTDGNHIHCSTGSPVDYPIDEACEDDERSWFYCPCDEMVVKRTYKTGTNALWLESTSPVVTPSGTYNKISMMIIHPEDEDIDYVNGKTFTRWQPMFKEGKDGYATGNHFHISVGTGDYNGGDWLNGWYFKSNDQYSFTPKGDVLRPEEAFYVDPDFTTIINRKGINFTTI